ncbi:hypothetical protein DFJ74DRAFT_666430 [Hyaloraphidium curvatum]|nr:hypothetical protein DFJ74DRAFT_666430 [Hyaloraphidium curvatum]
MSSGIVSLSGAGAAVPRRPAVPPELVLEVMRLLRAWGHRRTLLHLCLASKDTFELGASVLFREISVGLAPNSLSARAALKTWSACFAGPAEQFGAVRSLELRKMNGGAQYSQLRMRALSVCTDLEELKLWVDPESAQDVWPAIRGMKKLKRLEVHWRRYGHYGDCVLDGLPASLQLLDWEGEGIPSSTLDAIGSSDQLTTWTLAGDGDFTALAEHPAATAKLAAVSLPGCQLVPLLDIGSFAPHRLEVRGTLSRPLRRLLEVKMPVKELILDALATSDFAEGIPNGIASLTVRQAALDATKSDRREIVRLLAASGFPRIALRTAKDDSIEDELAFWHEVPNVSVEVRATAGDPGEIGEFDFAEEF